MSRAFRIRRKADGVEFLPISNIDGVMLDDLLGYEKQKQELRRNTETFLAGKRPTTSCSTATPVPASPPASRPHQRVL